MNVLGISGSLRKDSFNTKALEVAKQVVPKDVTLSVADIASIPPYNNDVFLDGLPDSVVRFRTAIGTADALLIATPEYNFSTSGVLKNAIDWASRPPDQPFDGKPIALLGAAAGAMGTSRAQYHLRQIFVFLNGHILNKPEVTISGAQNVFTDTAELADPSTREKIETLLIALVAWTKQLGN